MEPKGFGWLELGLAGIAMLVLWKVLDRVLPRPGKNGNGNGLTAARAEIAALRLILDKILRTLDRFAAGNEELPSILRSVRDISLDLVSRHEHVTKEQLASILAQLRQEFGKMEGNVSDASEALRKDIHTLKEEVEKLERATTGGRKAGNA